MASQVSGGSQGSQVSQGSEGSEGSKTLIGGIVVAVLRSEPLNFSACELQNSCLNISNTITYCRCRGAQCCSHGQESHRSKSCYLQASQLGAFQWL